MITTTLILTQYKNLYVQTQHGLHKNKDKEQTKLLPVPTKVEGHT